MSKRPNKRVQKERAERRELADAQFKKAKRVAASVGMSLTRGDETHYQLRCPVGDAHWLVNIYPGNCRVYANKKRRPRPPFVQVSYPWSLLEVVEAFALERKHASETPEE